MTNTQTRHLFGLMVLLTMSPMQRAAALTADLGSDGSYGPINVTTDTVIPLPPDGVIHATTITIAADARLSFSYDGIAHPGVVLLATGDVVIAGTLDVSGAASTANTAGRGGPGGSSGGAPSTYDYQYPLFQPYFFRPNNVDTEMGYRPIGGFGGTSARSNVVCTTVGAGGGGGGGSLVVISNTSVTLTGTMTARGGAASATVQSGCSGGTRTPATVGQDGYIRIVAPSANLVAGSVVAAEVRVEAVASTGAPTVTRGSVAGAGTYSSGTALARFPALPVPTIVAINGVTVQPSTAVQVPTGTPNPWNVTVRVVGCARSVMQAAVHGRTGAGDFRAGIAELQNPTGDDTVVVTIDTNASVFGGRASVLLYPAVFCGPLTTP